MIKEGATVSITCIACPKGCNTVVQIDKGGTVESIEGAQCKKGEEYLVQECTNPTRIVTSTVWLNGKRLLPVRSSGPVPKNMVLTILRRLASVNLQGPVKMGEPVLRDILGQGSDIHIIAADKCF